MPGDLLLCYGSNCHRLSVYPVNPLSLWARVRVREDFHLSDGAVGGMFVY